METFESIEELKYPQEYEDGGTIILNDFNEREMNDSRVQAMFRQSRHNNSTISSFLKTSTNYQRIQPELMEISITSSNLINFQTFVVFIKTKFLWI